MSTAVKKKLCWNCEGNVSRQADNCPYCGVYLHRENDDHDEEYDEIEEEDITPPYQPEPTNSKQMDPIIPTPPYAAQESPTAPEAYIQQAAKPLLQLSSGWKAVVFPLTFLLAGSVFLLFGLILFLFSQNGTLTLQWNGEYWYAYLLVALPLLYLGWNTLQNLSDES